MSEPTTAPVSRFTLRDLPLPAKLVVTVFLLAVGLGYFSALIQLHMQHGERDGTPLPSADNVISVFAGKKRPLPGGESDKSVSRLQEIISGSPRGNLTSKNMAPAFFAEDGADFEKRAAKPGELPKLEAEREGDRQAMIAWINAPPEVRKDAYRDDKFVLPKALVGQPMSPGYKANGAGVHIRSLIRDRCTRCHGPGGDKENTPLKTYEQITVFLPATAPVEKGGWVDSGRQISLEKLTQSTHAHLLSFAMLFSLTGLVFAFSSFPAKLRLILGPGVLVAQVADVSCWWLARLPVELGGPAFAQCIIGTGACVGGGLALQILLSLYSMYGRTGRIVLLLLFATALGGAGAMYVKVIVPFLEDERNRARAGRPDAETKPEVPPKNGVPNGTPTGPSRLEKLLNGTAQSKWNNGDEDKPDGGMVKAFFEKEPVFQKAVEAKSPNLEQLTQEREGERAALHEWTRAADDVRRKAYEEDAFPLPANFGKTITAEFKANDATVKVRSLLNARCAACHRPEGKKEDYPLTKYEEFAEVLKPGPAPAAKAGNGAIPPPKE